MSVLLCGYGTIEVCRVEVAAFHLPRVRVLSCLL
nr:MAG TPA: FAM198 family protein [Caudoviricetes sp.]